MAYGASLESWLGASPRGFESPILRHSPESGRHTLRHSKVGWVQAPRPLPGFESPPPRSMDAVRLRPYHHLLWRGIGAILAFAIPVFGALLYLTIPNGPWTVVVVGEGAALVVLSLAVFRYLRLGIWVDVAGIAERGFFLSHRRIPLEQLGSIVSAHTFQIGGADTVPQLFVCGHDGRALVRMRGQFWSPESMDVVVATLDAPLTEIDHPVSLAELQSAHPGLLYWFERHPVLANVLFAASLAVGGLALYALLLLLGAAL